MAGGVVAICRPKVSAFNANLTRATFRFKIRKRQRSNERLAGRGWKPRHGAGSGATGVAKRALNPCSAFYAIVRLHGG